MNRGVMGSGHGWAIGWAVAWNCRAKSFLNQQPPGAANWIIGSRGEQQKRAIPFDTLPLLPEGIYDSYSKQVHRQVFISGSFPNDSVCRPWQVSGIALQIFCSFT